jgi:hypothetical protein
MERIIPKPRTVNPEIIPKIIPKPQTANPKIIPKIILKPQIANREPRILNPENNNEK